jgi:hypothetical protein
MLCWLLQFYYNAECCCAVCLAILSSRILSIRAKMTLERHQILYTHCHHFQTNAKCCHAECTYAVMLNVVMLIVNCQYTECHYAECCGASRTDIRGKFRAKWPLPEACTINL